jgi:hypothetical protein
MPTNQPIPDVWVGNTFSRTFRLKDGIDPFDLTGSKLVFIAKAGNDTIRKATDDPGSGLSIPDPPTGEVLLEFTVAETRDMKVGAWRYELEHWVGSEQVSLIYGTMTVTAWVNDDVDP